MPSTTFEKSSSERGAGERIAKLLARAGIASRREVERMIADGRVALDGVAIDTPATVLTSLAGITVDGQPVAAPTAARLFIYHKPPGLLVTERDPAGRATIYDRLPAELPRVVPVGRLDLATEGLLLLTTDGGLKRQLELPATGVERTYRARAYGPVSQAQLEELIHGVEIEGMRYGAIDANLERRTGANGWIEMTLTEGKNREVRRVLEHLGLEVSRLIRTRYGPFVLGDLAPGEVGEVRQHDLEIFRKTLKTAGGKGAADMAAVAAQPLAKPVAAPPAPDRSRGASASAPRDGGRPRPAGGRDRAAPAEEARPQQRASSSAARGARHRGRDERVGGGAPDRADRQARPGGRDAQPRGPGDRPSAAPGARSASPARGERPARAGERDDRPRAFGDRSRAAAPTRAPRSPAADREAPRSGPRGRDDDRERAQRPARAEHAPKPAKPRSAPPRPASDRSPSGDRSRGPAGGRGKPQDPRRPKAPPRGKR